MEADDKNLSEDRGYQSSSSSCSSSGHGIEQVHNSSNDRNKQSAVLWPSAYRVRDLDPEQNKLSYQLPSSSSVGDCIAPSEAADIDELEDLLHRFELFFREKVDAELLSVKQFLHGMLSEQQIHLQQILSIRLQPLKPPFSQESRPLQSANDGFQDHKVPETSDQAMMQLSMAQDSTETYRKSAINEILLEVLSLSCELSAVLSQSKYL